MESMGDLDMDGSHNMDSPLILYKEQRVKVILEKNNKRNVSQD